MTASASPLLIPRTRLIGRGTERSAARTLLVDDAVPMLTLTVLRNETQRTVRVELEDVARLLSHLDVALGVA